MSRLPRAVWELVALLIIALGVMVAWQIIDSRHQQQLNEVKSQLKADLEEQREEVRQSHERLAASAAEGVLRAFVAGAHSAIMAGDRKAVDQALVALLQLPEVSFVHILEDDGSVIATSDRKLATAGLTAANADWALAVSELTSRPGKGAGTELAVAVTRPDETRAIVWIAYSTSGTE
jgi:predicted negative regulator of RcsB-dependent stress response